MRALLLCLALLALPGRVLADFASGEGAASEDAAASRSYPSDGFESCMTLDASYLTPLGGDIKAIGRFALTTAFADGPYGLFGLYMAGGYLDTKSGSPLDVLVKSPWTLESGIMGRLYFTGPRALISPYLTLSFGWEGFFWTYRTPVPSGSDTIHSDNLQAFNGYGGLGIAIARNRRLSLFGEAGFGGVVFAGDTSEGFHNAAFDNFGYFSVKAGLQIGF